MDPALPDLRIAPILAQLALLGSEASREGMSRHGINLEHAFASVHQLRKLAKHLGIDHGLALALWATENHEARLLAVFRGRPCARHC